MSTNKPDRSKQDLDAVLEKIAGWPAPYAEIGARLHETITTAGPGVKPRIWYGAPGYARSRSAPVLIFFRCDDGVMSLGLSPKELGLARHVVKPTSVIDWTTSVVGSVGGASSGG